MSTPESKIVVAIETLLRGMPKATRDLSAFEKRLRSLSDIKVSAKPISTTQIDKATIAAQRLQQQQHKLSIQSQELANRQERARQAADRLARSQERLAQQSAKASKGLNVNADAHVKSFRAIETGAKKSKAEVDKINAQTARQAKEQQRIQEQAGKTIARTQTANAKAGANALIESLNKSTFAGDRLDKVLTRVGGTLTRIGSGLSSFGRSLTVALTAPLVALGAISVKSATDLDAQINTLKAFTGSAEAAERRLSQLIATAQRTPGLTTQLGLMLDSQLRLANVTVQTIDKVLPAIGRLNAVQKLQDPARFSQNLVQLVTQNFERIDLKELVGQSPVAGQIIKEIFNVDSPINAEAIRAAAKRMGLTTTDAFFAAFAEAAARNPALATVTESIATQFSKFMDRITIALRPLGLAIINALRPIVDFIVPIIERLSRAFASLPAPIQLLIIAFGGLVAAAGPLLFITGHLVSGVGTLVVAYARLVALGLTPSIEGFRLLSQVMRGTAALTAGQAATTAAAASGWIALGGAVVAIVAVLAVAAVAIASYAKEQEKAVEVDKDAATARLKRIPQLKTEVAELEKLTQQQQLSAEQQELLKASYEALEGAARGRIALLETETERIQTLIAEKRKQLQFDEFEANATAVQLINNLTIALNEQAEAEKRLGQSREQFRNAQQIVAEANEFIAGQTRVNAVLEVQENASKKAAQALEDITQKGTEVQAAVDVIESLARASGVTTEQLLQQARAGGTNTDAIDRARKAIENYIPRQQELATVVAEATKEILAQNEALSELENDPNVVIAKSSEKALRSVLEFIKANTNSTEHARRALQNYIRLFPHLQKAVEDAGGIDAVIDSLTKKPGKRSETSIRNAREQLARAIARVGEASAEREAATEEAKNARLLRLNEAQFNLQLIAYRQYLNERARLTSSTVQREIDAQKLVSDIATAEQERLLARSRKRGLPETERVKAEAGAKEAEARRIGAEAKIIELRERQREILDQVRQDLRVAQKQQVEDVRQLDIEYAKLTNRIEDALNAATDSRFHEELQRLSKAQDDLAKRLEVIRHTRDADAIAELENALRLNQSQIDLIEGIVAQERATNSLAVAQRFVEQAKQRQADLEREIAFDVEFRGLKEDEAIRRRLAGEAKLADALRLSRDIIQDQIDALNAQALPIPRALLDFIRETSGAVQGLSELPFSEQFRLAEQEFNRINDERIRKIQDVERAVRNRDIAEVEGRIIIKRINGEYVADLEQQLALLKQIALASGQEGLRQQAQQAEETVKDTKDELASLSKQIAATGKDAFRSGLSTFFTDLADSSQSAKEDFLNFLDTLVKRINEVIAENLADRLFESIFGGEQGGGILDKVLGIFGLGGKAAEAAEIPVEAAEHGVEAAQHAATSAALTTGATAAATALTTGGTAAATALTTGGATASASLVTGIAAAASAFAAQIVAAGAAFAAAVASSAASQAVGGIGGALGAATGLFPAVPGGLYKVVEGGYPEAVLTTDPKHAGRQYHILKAYLQKTRGLGGRVPKFAEGGFISPRQTEMDLLSAITSTQFTPRLPAAALETAGGAGSMNLRIINQLTSREIVRPYVSSEEFTQDVLNVISRNSNEVYRRLPIRR